MDFVLTRLLIVGFVALAFMIVARTLGGVLIEVLRFFKLIE